MIQYRTKKSIMVLLDLIGITLSFFLAVTIRYIFLIEQLGSSYSKQLYRNFYLGVFVLYLILAIFREYIPLEKLTHKEILIATIKQQLLFIAGVVILFYIFPQAFSISRMVVGIFLIFNVLFCVLLRILYRCYCVKLVREAEKPTNKRISNTGPIHIYIIGAKSIGLYGGYETFVMNLLQQHGENPNLVYHIATKANGQGHMELGKMPGATLVNDEEFTYYNAHCFMIHVPEWAGSAQAIFYDLRAMKWACRNIEKNHLDHAVVYILASRIGPFERRYANRIRKAGGRVFQNPDGHENWRRKWSAPIRAYWKLSEKYSVKYADVVVCDSREIGKYIKEEYYSFSPSTVYIPYGSDVTRAVLADNDKN